MAEREGLIRCCAAHPCGAPAEPASAPTLIVGCRTLGLSIFFNRLVSNAVKMLLNFDCFSIQQLIDDKGSLRQGSSTTEIESGS